MPEIHFDTYYRYDDLTRLLQAYAAEYPELVNIESIGHSHEGRDVWLLTLTNSATGADRDKPALWVDGNIHASEVSASSACLYLIEHLVNGYGKVDEITRCLDTRVFYICPRINPDGAEWALADRPRIIRSSTRPYPFDEDPIGGLVREDIDGDGRVLTMRIPDKNGAWKASPDEPRLLIRRDPAETGGTYYRLLPEGRLQDYDGLTISFQPEKERLDLNRNFPGNWRQEFEQPGAGPYPTSEPEIRNMVHFIANHPNITGAITFHTFGGVLLRPFGSQPDENMPAPDLWTFQKIGQKGSDLTGYPAISIFHDFRYHPQEIITGDFSDWMYSHLGIFTWAVELWSPQRQAGITDYKFIDWFREHPFDDDLKLLKWSDEVLGGRGYIDWYPYEHPELGTVELGGWDILLAFGNPPPEFLERELAPFPDWLIWHLLISPRLELVEAVAYPLGDDTYLVRLVIENTGWLPTYVSKKALEKQVVRGVICEIELPEGGRVETGKLRDDVGQLEGRAYTPATMLWAPEPTDNRVKVEWTLTAPAGSTIRLTARHERAGVIRTELQLAD